MSVDSGFGWPQSWFRGGVVIDGCIQETLGRGREDFPYRLFLKISRFDLNSSPLMPAFLHKLYVAIGGFSIADFC